MAAAEAASEAAYYGATADGAFEPMASRIMSPASEAFPDRTAEMSTSLWSLASRCTGSAIIALGPNTKIEAWPGLYVTRATLIRRLRSQCGTDSAFHTAKVWLAIHIAHYGNVKTGKAH